MTATATAAVEAGGRTQATPAEVRKAIWAGGIGNFVEQFDFAVYGYLAPLMAPVFFPETDPLASVLSTYALFAISFLIRPVGGLVFGRFGDRVGRRKTLSLAIVLMGVLTALIGVLPSYAQVGFFAPALLLVVRILQGVVQGGEYVGAIAFIVEYAPERRRGFYGSFVSMSVFLGLLGGAGLSSLLTTVLPHEEMTTWGWRLPFLLALPLALTGLHLRLRIKETPEFEAATRSGDEVVQTPLREALVSQWRGILVFCGASITLAVLSYGWVTYLPQYLSGTLKVPQGEAFLSNVISIAVLVPLLPMAGALSDRIGRKPMLIIGVLACIFLVPLAFLVLEEGTFTSAVLGQLIYIVPEFFLTGIVTVCAAEFFPTKTRYSASAIAFNSSFAIFAGATPFIATLLVSRFGTVYALWGFLATLAVFSLFVILRFMQETYRSALSDDKYAAHN
ncbi:MFS transporter [Streptomyces diacarni]|uniref:Putative proline/betaine transporter n=1 Tax=Streptomyces diacarni TaxID=2800381 RepID=A0A367E8L1_9ACTN|nr:MFS transporter [Streptomyces diacarni]RCG14396.1 MFS transporter [Streptomyces diacarni]